MRVGLLKGISAGAGREVCLGLPKHMGNEKGREGEVMDDTRGDGPVRLVDGINLAIIPVVDSLCEAK